jgi:4-alpha-glucanotransferase
VWRDPGLFGRGASIGAPPDDFFTGGQDWGMPPIRPAELRRQGYRYWIEALRHHFRYAHRLRIDHVMGLHRLYWVPHGFPATHGLYVGYPARELYAILALEASRHGARVVGEDLGTVPAYVERELKRRRVGRTYVLPFAIDGGSSGEVIDPPQADTVASLNTHDMPPFAAFWSGDDIDLRRELGGLAAGAEEGEHEGRARMRERVRAFLAARYGGGRQPEAVLEALLRFLGESAAELVAVNLEDLWLEHRPQNVPGTASERPNWRRKLARPWASIAGDPGIHGMLEALNEARAAGSR